MALADFLARPVAYHPALARLVGSVPAAVMLSQAIYWQARVPQSRPPGCPGPDWWYHSIEEWEKETALGRDAQAAARKRLAGLLESRHAGLPARMWYRVNLAAVEKMLQNQQTAAVPQTRARQCRKLDGRFAANKSTASPQTSEITSESISDITTTTESVCEQSANYTGGSGDNEKERKYLLNEEEREYVSLAAQEYCSTKGFGPEKFAGAFNSIRIRLEAQRGLNDIDWQQFSVLRARKSEVQAMRARMAAQQDQLAQPIDSVPGAEQEAQKQNQEKERVEAVWSYFLALPEKDKERLTCDYLLSLPAAQRRDYDPQKDNWQACLKYWLPEILSPQKPAKSMSARIV